MPEETKQPDPFLIKSADPIGSGRFFYKLDTNQGTYYYTPTEFVEKGLLQGSTQYFDQGFLRNPDIFKTAKVVNVEKGYIPNMEAAGYSNPTLGILMNQDQAKYLLGSGKSTFSDWGNDTGAGWVDLYDINSTNSNTGSPYGAIQGLGQMQGQYVYVRPTESGKEASYIVPYDQFDTGYSMRNSWTEYSGIFGKDVAKALSKFAQSVGQIPFLTELTAAIPVVGPAVYGSLKGAQAAAAGKSPFEAALEVGANLAVAQGIKSLMPSGGVFGGDVEAQPGGFYGESTVPGGAIGPAPGVDVTAIGAPTTPEITAIGPEVAAPTTPEIIAVGPEAAPSPPAAPIAPEIPAENLVSQITQGSPTFQFDDGSKLQLFNDGSSIATDISGNVSSSIATDIVQPGYIDPNAPGFGGIGGGPAPIDIRDVGPSEPFTGKSTTESLWDLAKTAGETAYGLATDYPLTTLGIASALANTGEPAKTAPTEAEPAKKTYAYRAPIEYKPSGGLKELWRASEGIYGNQPPLAMPRPPAPEQTQTAQAPAPLLGGAAPGGISALRPTYTPLSGGPTVDIGQLSIDQLIQIQNALEGRRLGSLA